MRAQGGLVGAGLCLLAEGARQTADGPRRQEAGPSDLTQTLLSAALATWPGSQLSWVPK